ncbi:MAG: heparinase II/III family protein [Pseudomonadota bacterium]
MFKHRVAAIYPRSGPFSNRFGVPVLAWLVVVGIASVSEAAASEHPRLVLTTDGVVRIRAELGGVPLFDATLAKVRAEVDAEIARGIETPLPKDFSGGYTHERHKRNFLLMPQAGALFQILGDEKYAIFLRSMFLQYAAMYKDLPLHPQERSYARGKLFWQCLNDANWLLYASQGYDAIYDWLSAEERRRLEAELFRPFADFLSVENPQFFNRIHNHSTWGTAAVGMIGLVMGDDDLVNRALYGLDDAGLDLSARDNDGGFIRRADDGAGFLANLDKPFSPDGYYTEGPYYQRYAMYPFLMFGQSLHNAKPELGILDYKDGVLLKAVDVLLRLTDADGEFFPLNDAQKGMSYLSSATVAAVDIAYHVGAGDPHLLGVAAQQAQVTLDDAGFAVAVGIRDGLATPYRRRSVNLSDGAKGDEGGVAILRDAGERQSVVFKYSAQGLSHGHYDKLSFSLYEHGTEVLQDYGLVRFVNIEQKGGGNYLSENTTWAKQTIAHNTLTQDQQSHFGGKYAVGSEHHSVLAFYDASDPSAQVISAFEPNAYPNSELRRTMALLSPSWSERPILLDLFRVDADGRHQYDLPFWFLGQHLATSFPIETPPAPRVLGTDNGYQHLYVESVGQPADEQAHFQWLRGGSFYTLTVAVTPGDNWLFTRLGANDPDFNLRRDAAVIVRREATGSTLFASAIEGHGSYDPVSELTRQPRGSVAALRVLHDSSDYTAVELVGRSDRRGLFVVANSDTHPSARHRLRAGDNDVEWRGPFHFKEVNQ